MPAPESPVRRLAMCWLTLIIALATPALADEPTSQPATPGTQPTTTQPAVATTQAAVATTQPAGPLRLPIRVLAADGHRAGVLDRLSADAAVLLLRDGSEQTIPVGDIAVLQTNRPVATRDDADLIFLRNGDRLRGELSRVDANVLTIASEGDATFAVPRSRVAGLVFARGLESPQADDLVALAELGGEGSGELFLANGDIASGRLVSFEPGSLRFAIDGVTATPPVDSVRAITFARPDDLPPPPTDAALVYLTDGSRVLVRQPTLRGRQIVGTSTATGEAIAFEASRLSRIEMPAALPAAGEDRRFVWLSELSPRVSNQTPYFSLNRPPQRDRAVTGSPMRVDGQTVPRGFGLQPRTEMRFRLPAGGERLLASLAINDTGSNYSNADITITAGEQVFDYLGLQRGDPPVPVTLELDGQRVLELTVDFGLYGDLGDHVNLMDAVVVVGVSE